MPRKTNFRLNQDQERKLVDYVLQRKQTLLEDNYDRIRMDREAWERYNLNVEARQSDQGTIWPLSNLPVPVFPMVMEHFVSRCEDTTTGDEPYFHFEAVGALDEEKMITYDQFFNWKFKQGKIHAELQDSHLPTFVQKAHVLKAVFVKNESYWIDYDKVILYHIDESTGGLGEPVSIPGHGPVIQGEDEFTDMPDPIAAAHADPVGVAQGVVDLPMRKHLNADPTFVLDPKKHRWAPAENGLRRSEVIYAGAKTENVPYDRFLCPMDAESVQAADAVMELQDKPYSWIRDNWIERPWASWSQYAEQAKHGDARPKTQMELGIFTPQTKDPENRAFDTVNPNRKIIEAWVRRDVLGDGTGVPQEFAVFIDEDLRVAVYYEWQAKICPDMLRPYTVIAITKERNRWWGRSIYEKGKEIFTAIDRMWNGEFYRALQQANPPKGGDPEASVDGFDKIEYSPNGYIKLKPGKTMKDVLDYATVPDTNARSQMILEYMVFWIQLWLGISNLAQGDYQAVNTNTTKYGIAKTLEQASMLGRRWIRRVIAADEEHLTKLVQLTIATMPADKKEVYEYADGDQTKMGVLMGAELRQLRMHASVVLGQAAESQDIERCKNALEVQEKYLTQLNPEVRDVMRPLMLEVLEDLGFKDVDKLLPKFSATPVDKSAMGGEGAKIIAAASGDPALAGQLADNGGGGDQAQQQEQRSA